MIKHKHVVIRSLLIWLIVSFAYACKHMTGRGPADPGMSPVAMVVSDIHPWLRAQQIAENIPNSDVMVGHGDDMSPWYPDRTVLVLQRLSLANLRSGMTVVFHAGGGSPFNLRAEILVKQMKDGRWELASSNEEAEHRLRKLDEANYLGTVVAALVRATDEQKLAKREFVVGSSNLNCTIQCHIAGEIHPRVVPGLKPKVTTFDLMKDH